MDYIEMRVPAKGQYVSAIRLTISGLAHRVGFSYEQIEDLKIAVSEAVAKLIQHVNGDKEVEGVVIGSALYPHKLEVMVSDYGKRFSFEEIKSQFGPYREEYCFEYLREDGLDLYLMKTLMDEVRVNNYKGGTTVFMTKYVKEERVNDLVTTVTT